MSARTGAPSTPTPASSAGSRSDERDAAVVVLPTLDLDAHLAPEERQVFARRPLYGVAIMLVIAFGALLGAGSLHDWLTERSRRQHVHETLLAAYGSITESARNATPGELISLAVQWNDVLAASARVASGAVTDPSIRKARTDAGAAQIGRILEILDGGMVLTPFELSLLAERYAKLTSDTSLALGSVIDTVAGGNSFHSAVERATQGLVVLGKPDATLDDLEQGAAVASILSRVVSPALAGEYERAQAVFERRANFTRLQAAAAAREAIERVDGVLPAPPLPAQQADPETTAAAVDRRHRFASAVTDVLKRGGIPVTAAHADGTAADTLVLDASGSAETVLRVFATSTSLRDRLLTLGFVHLVIHGSDKTLVALVATGAIESTSAATTPSASAPYDD